MVLLIDDETRTYWDHITGEAVHGPLAGRQLEVWSVSMTTVAAALKKDPSITFSRSSPNLRGRIFGWFSQNIQRKAAFLPPGFRRTMGEQDKRLPRMTSGLGVVVDGEARFYPVASIEEGVTDSWDDKRLGISVGELDSIPGAEWSDGTRPFQLFTRWYGFSYTYPDCGIYGR